jgi:hypothetical protein
MSATFDLRSEVRAVLNDTSLSDPGDIADKVAEQIPARSLRRVLRHVLRSYVRQVISQERTKFSGPSQLRHESHRRQRRIPSRAHDLRAWRAVYGGGHYVHGTLGFRCQEAIVAALVLPPVIPALVADAGTKPPEWVPGSAAKVWRHGVLWWVLTDLSSKLAVAYQQATVYPSVAALVDAFPMTDFNKEQA